MAKNNILTKQQAIKEIVDRVNDWEISCLIEYVQDDLRNKYDERTLEEIEADYNLEFGGYDTDDDDYIKVIATKASRLLIDGVKKWVN